METFLKGIEDETLQKDIEADVRMRQLFFLLRALD